MKCPNCGSEQLDTSLFCGGCGEKLAQYYSAQQQQHKNQNQQNGNSGGQQGGQNGGKTIHQVGLTDDRIVQDNKKSSSGCVTIGLVVVAVVLVIIVSAVAGFLLFLNNKANKNPQVVTAPTEAVSEIVIIDSTPDAADTPVYEIENEDEKQPEVKVEEEKQEEEKQEETPMQPIISSSNYLFPSDTKYITKADLDGLTKDEVALIRNEIYARHGYIFTTNKTVKAYFESQSWYKPNSNFSESMFNEIERANKDFIVKYEKEKGWRK